MRQLVARWHGAVELRVELTDSEPQTVRALAYPPLVGEPAVGDRVLLNVTALARRLGTGGYGLVVALPEALPADPRAPLPPAGPGHIVKARYTPLQAMALGVDEEESPWHEVLREADDLAGMPVVVADLHSALPAIVAGMRHEAARQHRAMPRVAYVMTDGAALPAWFSRTIAGLRDSHWVAATITAGQAFGGDYEAVNVHTALLAARHVVGADAVVVSQGPGNVGTGTRWGFTGVAAGEAINATVTLGGRAVASLRVSQADPRPRHRGISHHSLTAYARVALRPADVVVPEESSDEFWQQVSQQAAGLAAPHGPHRLVSVPVSGLHEALTDTPVRLSTMGRGLAEDPASFLAVAAAGVHAQRLLG